MKKLPKTLNGQGANEYFVKYDQGGKNQDSIQGMVITAESAVEAVGKLELQTEYKLLDIRKL